MTKIAIVNHRGDQDIDSVIDGNKAVLLAKELALPASAGMLRKGKLWVANEQAAPQIIPEGMLICNAETFTEDCVSATTLTESSNMFQMEAVISLWSALAC